MNQVFKVSLVLFSLSLVSGGDAIAGEPEDIKTARWVGVEEGKLTCSVIKRTQKYDRASLDADLELSGGATYRYGQEMYSHWFREKKNSLVGVAIEAQHNYMRANCRKEFDKYMQAMPGYIPEINVEVKPSNVEIKLRPIKPAK